MIAVIFEVLPHSDRKQDYLDAASALRQHLEDIDGFISIERFESLTHPGKILSLSVWRDGSSGERLNLTDPSRQRADRISLPTTGSASLPSSGTTE